MPAPNLLKTEAKICLKFIAKFNQKLILVKKLATTIAALAKGHLVAAPHFSSFLTKVGRSEQCVNFRFKMQPSNLIRI